MSDSTHAPLAPSDASGWMNCPAKVKAQMGFPDSSSKFADEGSAMHEVRARCLRLGQLPMDYEGWIFFGGARTATLANRERLEFLNPGIDRLRELCGDDVHLMPQTHEPHHLLIEQTIRYEDRALADVYGTLDFGAYLRSSGTHFSVIVSDLKFGRGQPVYAENNEQQLIYADMFLDTLERSERRKVEDVRIIIDQPRCPGAGGEWVVTPDFIARWRDEKLLPAVEATKAREPRYVPGPKQCFWCRAKPGCAAYADFNIKTLGIEFDDERDGRNFSQAGIEPLSAERRAYLSLHREMIEKFLEMVDKTLLADALQGSPTPGLKAVLGNQGKRTWGDEDAAKAKLSELLGDNAFETKLISPTAAEALLPREIVKQIEPFWRREPAAPQLVSADHKKPAIEPIKMEDERKAS